MALYYAWIGIAGGIGQLSGGWLVEIATSLRTDVWLLQLDPYTPLFLLGILFPLAAIFLFRRVRADSDVTTREFATMFLRGNPFLAIESLVRYHRARDERAAVAMTARMAGTQSPLTDEELLEALRDPRFFVRFEAIVSIARREPNPRLTDALIQILEGDEPALSTIAAWALGRIGDERALQALRRGLNSRYRSVQAHCARSLGSLDDETVLPTLLDRLEDEQDPGLQLAYAAALGKLGATEAMEPILDMLQSASSMDVRLEFTLALGRLVGEEHDLIQLQRRVEAEPGTALSQAVTALKGKVTKLSEHTAELEKTLTLAADALAQEDLATGIALLQDALQRLPAGFLAPPCSRLVQECVGRLGEFGTERLEYAILALHAMDCR
jgi:HEAT repeat protein